MYVHVSSSAYDIHVYESSSSHDIHVSSSISQLGKQVHNFKVLQLPVNLLETEALVGSGGGEGGMFIHTNISMCVCVCACMYVYVGRCVCVVCDCVWLCVCVCVCVCMCIYRRRYGDRQRVSSYPCILLLICMYPPPHIHVSSSSYACILLLTYIGDITMIDKARRHSLDMNPPPYMNPPPHMIYIHRRRNGDRHSSKALARYYDTPAH